MPFYTPNEAGILAYERDGVACLRQAIDPATIARLRVGFERNLKG